MSGDTVPAVGVWVFPHVPAPELVDLARHVEDLGLDELWVGDEGPARDPFAVLAAAAVVTDRIRLATGITNPYVRHPGVAAASMLTIHELSGGRAVLGVGAGGQMSLAPFGLRASRPVDRVREFLDVAQAVATGTPAAGYSPSDVAVTDAAAGAPLPVFVGARGPRLNRLASERADGAFVAGMPPFRYPAVVGWARSVHPIDIALYPSVAFTEKAVERHRPEMIWALLDTPPEIREELGLDGQAVKAAAEAIRGGDPEPARNAGRRHGARTGDAGGATFGGGQATRGPRPRASTHEHRARPGPGRPARRCVRRSRGLRSHDRRARW